MLIGSFYLFGLLKLAIAMRPGSRPWRVQDEEVEQLQGHLGALPHFFT